MTLKNSEFIRRFLLHVLPRGFMRIRHYGYLANSNRTRKFLELAIVFSSLQKRINESKLKQKEKLCWHQRIMQQTGVHPLLCKHCRRAIMVLIGIIEPTRGAAERRETVTS